MKRTLLGTAALFVCVLAANMFTATTSAQGGDSRIQRGFELAPVPLDMKGLNPALVGLGSYIVNAQGGCNDCHTNPSYAPGGDPFAGEAEIVNAERYLAGGTDFLPSPFVSRNLTPRASNGRPAGLTLDQFIEVMRHGTDFKNGHPDNVAYPPDHAVARVRQDVRPRVAGHLRIPQGHSLRSLGTNVDTLRRRVSSD